MPKFVDQIADEFRVVFCTLHSRICVGVSLPHPRSVWPRFILEYNRTLQMTEKRSVYKCFLSVYIPALFTEILGIYFDSTADKCVGICHTVSEIHFF